MEMGWEFQNTAGERLNQHVPGTQFPLRGESSNTGFSLWVWVSQGHNLNPHAEACATGSRA